VNKPIEMMVYSSKTQMVRKLEITPSETWGGQGLLGVSIRFCSFQNASENVWRILEIQPNSPSEKAGLISYTDYVIGADSVLHESEDFYSLVEAHHGRQLKLYVYNLESDKCRDVVIIPNPDWGGEGSLGCDIGYGYLHRIPHVLENPPQELINGGGADGSNDQNDAEARKKTFSSVLGISGGSGEGVPQQQGPTSMPQGPPPALSERMTYVGSMGKPPPSVPASEGMPMPMIPTGVATTTTSTPSAMESVEIPGMPPQQTITTPLSIPGMPPITVSAPVMMPPSFASVPPTAAPPPTPIEHSWLSSNMPPHSFAPPGGQPQAYYPPPPSQYSPQQQIFDPYNPSSGYHQTSNPNLPPHSVPLFNPMSTSSPNNDANANPNFIRMYDPSSPPSSTN